MQSLPGRENLNNVCQQGVVTEQKDRNHAKVQTQGGPFAEKQVKLAIFLKSKINKATPKIFQVKSSKNISFKSASGNQIKYLH